MKTVTTAKLRTAVGRIACASSALAFCLPFVTVRSCETGTVEDFIGFQLLFEGGGWILSVPLVTAGLLLGLSFARPPAGSLLHGFLKGWALWSCALAGYIVGFGTYLIFLFDRVTPRIGFFVSLASWGLALLMNLWDVAGRIAEARRTLTDVAGTGKRRVSSAIALHGVCAVLLLSVPVLAFAADQHRDAGVLSMYILTVPLLPVLYLGVLGLRGAERWSVRWSVSLSIALLVASLGGILWSVLAPRPWLLLALVPACLFCGAVLADLLKKTSPEEGRL
jgi:hypothetical protein